MGRGVERGAADRILKAPQYERCGRTDGQQQAFYLTFFQVVIVILSRPGMLNSVTGNFP